MIRVAARLHATLRKYLPAGATGNDVVIELDDGARLGDLLRRLGIPREHAGMTLSAGTRLDMNAELSDGQEVNFFPPFAGGI